jgi:hypothetical protein
LFAVLIAVPVSAQPAQDPPPPSKPAPQSVWSSGGLTGDWGGARTDMKNKGVELDLALYQFYQGVASGGVNESSEYFGTFQTVLKSDLGKMAGWNFWSIEFKTETRFGGRCPRARGASIRSTPRRSFPRGMARCSPSRRSTPRGSFPSI